MVTRHLWRALLEKRWKDRSIVWLAGVRRSGKTCLAQTLPDVEYLDCERPRVRRLMEDPEGFLRGCGGRRMVLDEVHRLPNPSEILKIAADHYPSVRILATGSSTLGASAKFRDTLAGRKRNVWLTPMTLADLDDFGRPDLERRLLRGGLPPFFLAEDPPERDFQEWMDAYWAKDVQEMFRLERRASFQRLAELLFAQSGGMFDATRLAAPCEVSRNTISNYLRVLEETFVVHVVRPYSRRLAVEIVSAPKVYAFDTGFVCYHRGWDLLRPEDRGQLWEHLVLNEIHARLQTRRVRYWRDKRGHEVDFVLPLRSGEALAIECKSSESAFDPAGLLSFRRRHPAGENVLVAPEVDRPHERSFGPVRVRFEGLASLVDRLAKRGAADAAA